MSSIISTIDQATQNGTPSPSNEDPHDKISLETRLGRRIPNYKSEQEVEPPPDLIGLIWRPRWQTRALYPVPAHNYNCAGHVWANRRAAIEVEHWPIIQMILDDDGYRRIERSETQPDDLALYIAAPPLTRELLHVARIIVADHQHGRGVHALSKLGNQFGEIIHQVDDINLDTTFNIEFWTDRLPSQISR